ncbi:uncharacterized protein FIBRA_02791 [Fibroporia radiculosa]|uniref:Tetratricopeptide SHNi-TPR domain-containing protein n=1 Tax=Fibroporia radiculosa TaxID=599839 RepID=J4I991_9APHY|nr:uncharacterized protein FIBRA_02791 [Fibroporia radiculosa]CCM00751.1 predicted protein [Fibroporia radiculosa]
MLIGDEETRPTPTPTYHKLIGSVGKPPSSSTPEKSEVTTPSLEDAVEHAKRAFALRKYEQAVDHYATALELMTTKYGENAPETADLYFSYGKALLENAISQTSVLGKEQTDEAVQAAVEESAKLELSRNKFLSFSGDADDADDSLAESKEDVAVDLFAEAQKVDDDEDDEDDEEDNDVEPEDDFNAAWEVLDLARAIYEKQQDDNDEVKLRLADTFIALGDVSLETEKFDQAITDYSAALTIKVELLPQSSRQIAEAHYKLSIVLDLTSGRLGDAITHAEQALESVEARLAELRDALSGQGLVRVDVPQPDVNGKGKGKASGPRLLGADAVSKMSKSDMEAEVKELRGLKDDLALKVEELKTSPEEVESAPAMAAKALDAELNTNVPAAAVAAPQTVTDLTSMVKKKKKDPEATGAMKRKAEDEPSLSEKKAKIEDPAP